MLLTRFSTFPAAHTPAQPLHSLPRPAVHSFTRELHDTPAVAVGGKAITWLLSVCEGLNPANMALLAGLLVGPSVAGGPRCLYDYSKGRYGNSGVVHCFAVQSQVSPMPAIHNLAMQLVGCPAVPVRLP